MINASTQNLTRKPSRFAPTSLEQQPSPDDLAIHSKASAWQERAPLANGVSHQNILEEGQFLLRDKASSLGAWHRSARSVTVAVAGRHRAPRPSERRGQLQEQLQSQTLKSFHPSSRSRAPRTRWVAPKGAKRKDSRCRMATVVIFEIKSWLRRYPMAGENAASSCKQRQKGAAWGAPQPALCLVGKPWSPLRLPRWQQLGPVSMDRTKAHQGWSAWLLARAEL